MIEADGWYQSRCLETAYCFVPTVSGIDRYKAYVQQTSGLHGPQAKNRETLERKLFISESAVSLQREPLTLSDATNLTAVGKTCETSSLVEQNMD